MSPVSSLLLISTCWNAWIVRESTILPAGGLHSIPRARPSYWINTKPASSSSVLFLHFYLCSTSSDCTMPNTHWHNSHVAKRDLFSYIYSQRGRNMTQLIPLLSGIICHTATKSTSNCRKEEREVMGCTSQQEHVPVGSCIEPFPRMGSSLSCDP